VTSAAHGRAGRVAGARIFLVAFDALAVHDLLFLKSPAPLKGVDGTFFLGIKPVAGLAIPQIFLVLLVRKRHRPDNAAVQFNFGSARCGSPFPWFQGECR